MTFADVMAWLAEHAATLTAILYVARKSVEIRLEREKAARVTAEAVDLALKKERARCDGLERQLTALGKEFAAAWKRADLAGHSRPFNGGS